MQYNDILVRKPKFEDFPAIAEIKVRGWQTAYDEIVDKAFLRKLSAEQISEKMRENQKGDRFLLAEIMGEIVGFCRYRVYEKTGEQEDCSGAISELYVKPERKRMGIGEALFQRVTEDLKNSGCRNVFLSCFSENVSALAFYAKMNGKFIGKENFEIDGRKYAVNCYQFAIQK